MEALLGSMQTYAVMTQALFFTPLTLTFIILYANESRIPQEY